MKKRMLAILLSALLAVNMSACADGSKGEFAESPESTAPEYHEIVAYEEPNGSDEKDDVNLTPLSRRLLDSSGASFYIDRDGEYWVYIFKWGSYYQLPELSKYSDAIYHKIVDEAAFVLNENSCSLAVTIRKQTNNLEKTTIIIYHFDKDRKEPQVNLATLDAVGADGLSHCTLILHDKSHGYFFNIPDYTGHEPCWPLLRYETTDGGKTWSEPVELVSINNNWKMFPEMLKFVTKNVGILEYRNNGAIADLGIPAYYTTDGGTTWQWLDYRFPYPNQILEEINMESSYADIIDLKNGVNTYYLEVGVSDGSSNIRYRVMFSSEDLKTWNVSGYSREEFFEVD